MGIAGSGKKIYHQDDLHLGLSSNSSDFDNNDQNSGSSSNRGLTSGSSSRRNSHLPALLHSKTTINSSTFTSQSHDEGIHETGFRDVSVQNSRRGSGTQNNIPMPLYNSASTPVISTELFPSPGATTQSHVNGGNGGNPLHKLANLTVSTNSNNVHPGIADFPTSYPHTGTLYLFSFVSFEVFATCDLRKRNKLI